MFKTWILCMWPTMTQTSRIQSRNSRMTYIPVSFESYLCPVCVKVVNKMSDYILSRVCYKWMNYRMIIIKITILVIYKKNFDNTYRDSIKTPPEFVIQWTCPTSHVSPIPESGANVSRQSLSKCFQWRVSISFHISHPPSPSSPCTCLFHIAVSNFTMFLTFLTFRRRLPVRGSGSCRDLSIFLGRWPIPPWFSRLSGPFW